MKTQILRFCRPVISTLLLFSCANPDRLEPDMIQHLVLNKTDQKGHILAGDNAHYDVTKIVQGSFTMKGRKEALVAFSVTGDNIPYPDRGKSIWLLEYETNWNIIREIGFFVDDRFRCYPEDEKVTQPFQAIDLEKDGTMELFIIHGFQGGGGGEAHEYGKVLSLTPDSTKVLFSYTSFDYAGISVAEPVPDVEDKGIISTCHRISFVDSDSDGTLELVDEEETEYWYRTNTEETSINRWFEVDRAEVVATKRVFKLKDSSFSEQVSEEKQTLTKSF